MLRVLRFIAPPALALAATTGFVSAAIPMQAMAAEVSDGGSFRDADGSHPASGKAEIIKLKGGGFGLKLHGDFKVRGGPDLRVWLSEAGNPRSGRAVRAADYVDLGRLTSSSGEQIYRIPDNVKLADIGSVVIWCRAFGVFFGSASLA